MGYVIAAACLTGYTAAGIWNFGRLHGKNPHDEVVNNVCAIFWPANALYILIGLLAYFVESYLPRACLALRLHVPFVVIGRVVRAIYESGKKHRDAFPEF